MRRSLITLIIFKNLCLAIGNIRPNLRRNVHIHLEKKVLFTIWILAKQESFLACGDRFGMARSTGHYILDEIVSILVELMPEYIRWPDDHREAVNVC